MSLWIKICANTSVEDVLVAVDAGADAVGFVFAPSPRRVKAAQVAAIVPHLPPVVEKIGVFVDAGLEEIEQTVRASGLTGVQLHSDVGPDVPAQLRSRFGPVFRILRVVHFGHTAQEQVTAIVQDANVDAILVDSRTATAVGGTGIAFDWQRARDTVFHGAAPSRMRMVVAGGLTPSNVAEAIEILNPWGVDVVSGVEAIPGRKDPAKVRDFISHARAALLHRQREELK
ncbi:MAG TPA: phosphoribosylanthranilate isomerase [Terracidiphilus sp.]|nr:phosphoribosylanthranilate isomerase [Terracidiphilus sp.]